MQKYKFVNYSIYLIYFAISDISQYNVTIDNILSSKCTMPTRIYVYTYGLYFIYI